MVHRGPDDGGEYFDDEQGLGMGFRRLSVIDLSAAGHQPMANEDGTIWLAFNGEIYNFQELRRDLLASGHAFRSRTDSEVILHQYEESGMRCTDYLNGMFAFALWDRRSRRLLLARDRLGKKPLYYYDDGKRLIYASELKAILVNRIVPRDLDGDALGEYLSRGYVSAPRTIFRSVQQLLPAHWMVFENGESKAERYWDWLPAFRSDQTLTEEEWTQKVQSILKTVVRERLNSDVSLGAFLSGGIDSSAVVATMAHLGHQPIRTFSIGFRDQDYDELPYARMVAKQFATDHHEFYLEPESVRELLPRLINQFDEPLADASALPTYYLSKVARREVTVCLSGDGGDEACAGHDRYVQSFREQTVDCVPMALRRLLLAPARILPWGVPGRRLASRLALGPVQRYVSAVTHIPQELLTQLLTPEASRWIGVNGNSVLEDALGRAQHLDLLSRIQYADGQTYLPGDILVKVDRACMLNSLEVRCPLLDYRFLELMSSVPPAQRLNKGGGKRLFKKALKGYLPEAILDRDKMGFGVPLGAWFRDDLKGFFEEILLDRPTVERGIFSVPSLERLIHSRRLRLTQTLWALLVFELWCRQYLDEV